MWSYFAPSQAKPMEKDPYEIALEDPDMQGKVELILHSYNMEMQERLTPTINAFIKAIEDEESSLMDLTMLFDDLASTINLYQKQVLKEKNIDAADKPPALTQVLNFINQLLSSDRLTENLREQLTAACHTLSTTIIEQHKLFVREMILKGLVPIDGTKNEKSRCIIL